MTEIRQFIYTKDNGDVSERKVVVVSKPRENYLCYDVTNLSEEQEQLLVEALEDAEMLRNEYIMGFQEETGININALWRSFKPEGIEWLTEDAKV